MCATTSSLDITSSLPSTSTSVQAPITESQVSPAAKKCQVLIFLLNRASVFRDV